MSEAQASARFQEWFPEVSKTRLAEIYSESGPERGDLFGMLYRLTCIEQWGNRADPLRVAKAGLEPTRSVLGRVVGGNGSGSPATPSGAAIRSPSPVRSPSMMRQNAEQGFRYQPSCDWCGRQMAQHMLRDHISYEHNHEHARFMSLRQEMTDLRVNRVVNGQKFRVTENAVYGWGEIITKVVVPHLENATSFADRMQVIKSLQVLIRSKSKFEKATVYLFGSSVTGLAVQDSDTDVAVDLFGTLTQAPPSSEAQLMEEIYNHFTDSPRHPWIIEYGSMPGQDVGLKKILRTRVPILANTPTPGDAHRKRSGVHSKVLEFKPSAAATTQAEKLKEVKREMEAAGLDATGDNVKVDDASVLINCKLEVEAVQFLCGSDQVSLLNRTNPPLVYSSSWDMSARLYGVRNSQLLRRYLAATHHRIAAAAVKIWSKKLKINDPKIGLLSSYSIALMFVYYLMRTGQVEFINPESIDLSSAPPIPSFRDIDTPHDPVDRRTFTEQVGQAFVGFITFYCFDFDWESEVITLVEPGVVRKTDRGWTEKNQILVDRGSSVRYHLCVEDPYEHADAAPWGEPGRGMLNVTRKITEHRALEVHNKFVKTLLTIHQDSNFEEADKLF